MCRSTADIRIARTFAWARLAIVLSLTACGSGSPTDDNQGATGGAAGAIGVNDGGGGGVAGNPAPNGGMAGGGLPSVGGSAFGGTAGATVAAGGSLGSAGTSGSGGSPTGGSTGVAGGGTAGGAGSGGASASGGGGGASGAPGSGGAPQVGLPPGVTYLFPPPNGTGVCPDPPLRLGFSAPPALGASGKIEVLNQSGSVVASVDMAVATVSDTLEGTTLKMPRPAFVDGNDVVIYLKNKSLAYGQTYSVTVDSGAIRPASGAFSLTGSSAWKFSTKAAAPGDLSALTVALDGSGDFCSVQGAADALPANNSKAALITINAGNYHEFVHMSGKANITFHGQDRKGTVILGANNNALNPSTATRSLVGFDNTSGLIVENLTIHNTTPQDGTQAEALRMQSCDKCVVRNADILSLQDTLLWSGRVYADNCYIAGNVDYIWGTGVAYFNQCEIHTVGRTGVLVQSRNASGAYGYVFVDSKLTADAAAANNMLGRIDASTYPGSHVAYINCQMTNIAPAGWTITGGAPTAALRFWEYQSVDAAGNAINTSARVNGSARILSPDADKMRDVTVVLNGWSPPK